MKSLTKLVMCLGLVVCFTASKAQTTSSSPRLFDAFSDQINCSANELEKIFTTTPGSDIQLRFGGNFILQGNLTSSKQRFSNLRSAIIRSSNFEGAILSISRRINDDNTITFVGRLLHEGYADGFDLKKDVSNNYILNKIKTEELLQD